MRGKMNFLMKGIYLILVIIIIAIVINQITTVNVGVSKGQEENRLREKSMSILDTLVGSTKCLGYEESGKVEGKNIDLASHRIIDVEKLKNFSKDFADLEPDCARDFEFGYRVSVETLPINITTSEVKRQGGVLGKILELIDGKKTVFIADVSGSMGDIGGNCDIDPNFINMKICCLKLFLIGFVEKMKDESMITIIPYGDNNECNPIELFPFTKLEGNRARIKNEIMKFTPIDGTPMCKALERGFEFAINNGGDAIVLLTDGCENICCYSSPQTPDIANQYKSSGIPVYTVAYGSYACIQPLEETAKISGGEYFDARTCEELISTPQESINVKMSKGFWQFGDSTSSENEALKGSDKISIPVIIYYNESTFIPGTMTIRLFNGELEKLVGFIEQTCLTGVDSTYSLFLDYPTSLEVREGKNYICIKFPDKKNCQMLACDKQINFSGTSAPGNYMIQSLNEANILKIII
jgi:hypothetical protein